MDSSVISEGVNEVSVPQQYSSRRVVLGWKKSGWTALVSSGSLLTGMFICYAITVGRGNLPPLLPMVSAVGGVPPASGFFTLIMVSSNYLALLARYLIIITALHRNVNNSKFIKKAQSIARYIIVFAFTGGVITGANPLEFTDVANMYEFLTMVVVPHAIGAISFIFCGIVFQMILTSIWWNLPDATKTNKRIKLTFMGIYVLSFMMCMSFIVKTKAAEESMHFFDIKLTEVRPFLRNFSEYKYPTLYLILAYTEWAVSINGLTYLLFLYKDLQNVGVRIVLCRKTSAETEKTVKRQ